MYIYFSARKLILKGTPTQVYNMLRMLCENEQESLGDWLKRHTTINKPRE